MDVDLGVDVAKAKQRAESEAREAQGTAQAAKEADSLQRDLGSMEAEIRNLATKQELEALKSAIYKAVLASLGIALAISMGANWAMGRLVLSLLERAFVIQTPPMPPIG